MIIQNSGIPRFTVGIPGTILSQILVQPLFLLSDGCTFYRHIHDNNVRSTQYFHDSAKYYSNNNYIPIKTHFVVLYQNSFVFITNNLMELYGFNNAMINNFWMYLYGFDYYIEAFTIIKEGEFLYDTNWQLLILQLT